MDLQTSLRHVSEPQNPKGELLVLSEIAKAFDIFSYIPQKPRHRGSSSRTRSRQSRPTPGALAAGCTPTGAELLRGGALDSREAGYNQKGPTNAKVENVRVSTQCVVTIPRFGNPVYLIFGLPRYPWQGSRLVGFNEGANKLMIMKFLSTAFPASGFACNCSLCFKFYGCPCPRRCSLASFQGFLFLCSKLRACRGGQSRRLAVVLTRVTWTGTSRTTTASNR